MDGIKTFDAYSIKTEATGVANYVVYITVDNWAVRHGVLGRQTAEYTEMRYKIHRKVYREFCTYLKTGIWPRLKDAVEQVSLRSYLKKQGLDLDDFIYNNDEVEYEQWNKIHCAIRAWVNQYWPIKQYKEFMIKRISKMLNKD